MPEPTALASLAEVIRFWAEAGPDRWFRKDEAFDAAFRDRFLPTHEAAARGDLAGWAGNPDGALALLVLLDQFPRNAFRGRARMYATDALARTVAQRAMDAGWPLSWPDAALQDFFRLPFSHSEWLPDQQRAVALASAIGGEPAKWARHHHDVVARFGRFPHRNALLGRVSSAEERAFIEAGGFAG